ncbi:hypothetical protein BH23BAC2_BH23BAC2_25910 [soil metagenome]
MLFLIIEYEAVLILDSESAAVFFINSLRTLW